MFEGKIVYWFCPKCSKSTVMDASRKRIPIFCTDCGTKMVLWTLTCQCGALIPPAFFGNEKPQDNFCRSCGRPTAELAKQKAVDIKVKLLSPTRKD